MFLDWFALEQSAAQLSDQWRDLILQSSKQISVTIYFAWLVGVRTPNLDRSKQPFIREMLV